VNEFYHYRIERLGNGVGITAGPKGGFRLNQRFFTNQTSESPQPLDPNRTRNCKPTTKVNPYPIDNRALEKLQKEAA
jgi:hypothetical protein